MLFYQWNNEKNHYQEDVFIDVLKDIKNQGYLKGSTDSNNMNNISALITEYQQKPFCGLEINQKDYLITLESNLMKISCCIKRSE